MNQKYDMSEIMKAAHFFAKEVTGGPYKERFIWGLRKAWRIAKGGSKENTKETPHCGSSSCSNLIVIEDWKEHKKSHTVVSVAGLIN